MSLQTFLSASGLAAASGSGSELVPRFRVFAFDGDTVVFNPLPVDLDARQARMAQRSFQRQRWQGLAFMGGNKGGIQGQSFKAALALAREAQMAFGIGEAGVRIPR